MKSLLVLRKEYSKFRLEDKGDVYIYYPQYAFLMQKAAQVYDIFALSIPCIQISNNIGIKQITLTYYLLVI